MSIEMNIAGNGDAFGVAVAARALPLPLLPLLPLIAADGVCGDGGSGF